MIVSDQDLESGLIARLRDTTASDAVRAQSADQLYEMVTDTLKPRRQYVAYLLDAALGDPASDVRRRATLAYGREIMVVLLSRRKHPLHVQAGPAFV